ncbi:MAG: GxxExxY protein [Bacteroidales bacterium]|nr:GxxExxY protein [Bacteroidales bacterium]
MIQQERLEQLNKISEAVIGAAIEVHKYLGPGLLESVYEICLIEELEQRGLKVQQQVRLPLYTKDNLLRSSLSLTS